MHMATPTTQASDAEILLVYDEECPFCNAYCRLVRIREAAGRLRLVNARDAGSLMEDITRRGLDIDQGMVLKVGDVLYYGSDAIHALSLMSGESGLFNRLNYWVFRSHARAKLLYPMLRSARNFGLKLLGKSKINNLGLQGNHRF
jgi:predicted DCC family thiol-disulfide oxidoreductase YuxK